MFGSSMTALQGFTLGVAVLSAILSVGTALLGDWFKERFGFRGMAQLTVEVDNRKPFFSHTWFRSISSLLDRGAGVTAPPDDRLKVQVLRVLVRNNGHNAAKNVSLWLTRLDTVTPNSDTRADENVVALRWADTWRFVTDKSEGTISPSETDINFPLIPAQSAKFCDLCVFYDSSGPDRLDQFERGRLYFAVYNIPSRTFSRGAGCYHLTLQAVAENARPARMTVRIEFEPNNESSPLRIVRSRA